MTNHVDMEEALKRFIVSQMGRGVSEDDIIYDICQRMDMSWGEAESLVYSVSIYRSRQIARRQMVILSALGLSTILAGSVLIGLFIHAMIQQMRMLSSDEMVDALHSIGILLGLIVEGQFAGELVFGSALIAGGLLGLKQVIRRAV